MKFWKSNIASTLLSFSALALVLSSSCEQNVCNNVTCYNGGGCNSATGVCTCPVGFTGPVCADSSRSVFEGTYYGFTVCNDNNVQGPPTIDTITVVADPSAINWVYVTDYVNNIKLHGYISTNESVYSIVVQSDTSANYQQIYDITLQSNTKLTFTSFTHDLRVPADTVNDNCVFTGSKQ